MLAYFVFSLHYYTEKKAIVFSVYTEQQEYDKLLAEIIVQALPIHIVGCSVYMRLTL